MTTASRLYGVTWLWPITTSSDKQKEHCKPWKKLLHSIRRMPGYLWNSINCIKKLGVSHTQRLEKLKRHMSLTEKRDDVYLEYITLNNMLGNHLEAQQDLAQRKFHPWEGGEGKVPGQYLLAQNRTGKIGYKSREISGSDRPFGGNYRISAQSGRRQTSRSSGKRPRLLPWYRLPGIG